jgi:hypothetical protein
MHNIKKTISSAVSLAALFGLPASAMEGEWDTAGFVENATFVRQDVGLTKFRNTAQFEFSKDFGTKFGLNNFIVSGTLRGTYDGVYDLNDDEFGKDAGGARSFENFASGNAQIIYGSTSSPWGGSILGTGAGPGFGFNTVTNPNDGLVVLGEAFHDPMGGVTIGVPVRPCDVDSRGCIDDYLDYSTNDLRFPEFNNKLDFIRELYFEGSVPMGGDDELFFRVGKQQVVWGRTDLFRVLDVINPVDFGRHNIYDELEDIRQPLWMATAEMRWGATDLFDDLNLQFVWNFDEFRPNNLGQGGTPYSILDAGSFFRAMKNCWDNGCTVSNFVPAGALIAGGAPLPDQQDPGLVAADFGPGVIGIRDVDLPEWKWENQQYGMKLEGVYKSVGFSLNYYHYFSQLPTLRGGIEATNAFTGEQGVWPYLIAFDIGFAEVDMLGGSLDFYVDPLKTVFRIEAAITDGEEFANTLRPELYSESNVARWVLGVDRNTFIPFLNKNRAFLISGQLFGEHILDHEQDNGPLGKRGIPNWENNYTATLLIKGWYKSDTISPQIIVAHDFKAGTTTLAPSVDWLVNDKWRVIAGFNIKVGDGAHAFDDCRTCNPFPPFTAGPGQAQPGSLGLGGLEPLGRFRAGPLGNAIEEDEFQLTVRYRF